jgi:hypothetical protein
MQRLARQAARDKKFGRFLERAKAKLMNYETRPYNFSITVFFASVEQLSRPFSESPGLTEAGWANMGVLDCQPIKSHEFLQILARVVYFLVSQGKVEKG